MANVHHQWYLPTPEKNNPNHWQTSLLCYCCWTGSTPQLSWQETKAERVSIFITADGRFYYLLFLSPSLLGLSQHCQLMTLSVPPVVLVRPPKALAPKAHGWGGGGLSIFVSSAKIRFHPHGFREKKKWKEMQAQMWPMWQKNLDWGGMWRELIKIGCFCRYFQICMGSPELCFYGSECMTPWTASAGKAGLLLLQPPNQPQCITGLPKFLAYSAFLFEFSFLASVTVF